jgi:hypothetical protein
MNLNPAGLALFTDWVTTLPPRPLPRTVTPVAGEYHLDYIARLARANRLQFLELAEIVNDTAAITLHRGRREWEQHQQERLATLSSQPLARITRLWWPGPAWSMRDPGTFRQALRPACWRCTARRGITEPVECHLLPHQAACRRHQLWTGPAARSHDQQLDISPFPEILRAHRRHLAPHAIYQAIRDGTWIAGQQHRLNHFAPGTWQQALAAALAPRPWRPDGHPGHPAIEIAIYPDVIWIAARSLRTRNEMAHSQSW